MAKRTKCGAMKSGCKNGATTEFLRGGVLIPSCSGCFNFQRNLKNEQLRMAAERDDSPGGAIRRTDPISGRTWLERGTECA